MNMFSLNKKYRILLSAVFLLTLFSLVSVAEAKVVTSIAKGLKVIRITGVITAVTGNDITLAATNKKTGAKTSALIHLGTSRESRLKVQPIITSDSIGKTVGIEGTKNSDGSINALSSEILKSFQK